MRMRLTWVFAVAGVMMSRSAISAFVRPAATRIRTSRSRLVSSCSSAGVSRLWGGRGAQPGIRPGGAAGGQQRSPAGDDAHGGANLVGLDILEQESAGAGGF